MARYTLAAVLLVAAGILTIRQDGGQELQGPPLPGKEVKLPPADEGRGTHAFVTATGLDWIEVREPEVKGITRYPVAGEALAPPPPDLRMMVNSHRLWEVRPGDKVVMQLHTRAGIERCEEIVVCRRPGGVVPPRLGEVSAMLPEGTFAHRANAEQAHEERGVPLPPEYANPKSLLSGAPPVYPDIPSFPPAGALKKDYNTHVKPPFVVLPNTSIQPELPLAPPPRAVNRAP